MDSKRYWEFTVGHEVTHSLEQAKAYQALKRAVFQYAKNKGEYQSRYDALKEAYNEGTDIESELVADLVGDYIFSDYGFAAELSAKDQNVFQKVFSTIKHLAKLVTAGSKEARQLEIAKRNFEKAYRETSKARLSGKGNVTTDTTVQSDEDLQHSIRTEDPPKKTRKAYKLMRLVDGKLYPLFIGNNEEVSVGTWYNADSPNLSQLKDLAPGTHLVNMTTGEAMTWDEYAEQYVPQKNGKPARSKPNKDDVHWANDNGYRFMHIEDKAGGASGGRMLKQYGDTRAYYNWGVNGSSKSKSGEGSASLYALRPGWHFGEVPSMHQIGYGGEAGDTVRLDNQVWVEVDMSADVDYNAEAASNWGGDIPTHIPTDGYYKFATNPTQKKTKGGNTANDATKADWYVAGAFKVNRIMSDSEADAVVEAYNRENGRNVPLDYRRNGGRVFNAETMQVEDAVQYSLTEAFVDSDGNHYDNAVLLDTDFFDGDPPRRWGDKLRKAVDQRASTNPFILPIVDESGQTTLLQFASPDDRVRKNGGSEHRVLDELSTTSDNISKLAVVHIDEIVSVSEENAPYYTPENSHGWMDKNGWLHRNANVINKRNGNIYNLTVDIAKAADGRTILYATDGKIKKVGTVKVNSLKIKGSRQNSNFARSVSQNGKNVKHSLSVDTEGRQLSDEQKVYFADSKVVDENGSLKVMYHGTSKGGFNMFDTYGSNYGLFGTGSYFTDSKTIAESYTKKGRGKSPQVYETYLNITNPMDMDAQADPREWQKAFPDADFPESGTNEQFYRAVEEFYADQWMSKWEVAEEIQAGIESGMGYDGITHIGGGRVNPNGERHQVYIAFQPEQIKSVANTQPTSDPDIRYSVSQETDTRFTPAEVLAIQSIGRKSIKSATDNIGTFDKSNPDIRYSLSDDRSYAEITEEQQKLSQRERLLAERQREASSNPELLQAMDDVSSIFTEVRGLLAKKHKGTATQEELARIEELKALREVRMKRVADLQESLGLGAIADEASKIREEKEALRIAADAAWAREGAEKENIAIEKSGLSASEYFRKKALKAFKTTTNFNEAGYLLPDGKLLNFSGGERNHRYRDHREIGEIYEATQGVYALNRFMSDGNIRVMAESPGIDLASGVEPTREQYVALRRFINSNGVNDGQFFVDFSDTDGRSVGKYSYQGRIFADRIINDIKYFFQTGKVRESSGLMDFLSLTKEGEEGPYYGPYSRPADRLAYEPAPVQEVGVAENATVSKKEMVEMFPDDIVPAEDELESLVQERINGASPSAAAEKRRFRHTSADWMRTTTRS